MTVYIGVDIHARQQTVSYLDTEDGSIGQQELHHERADIRGFYSLRWGSDHWDRGLWLHDWFEELMEELGHKLLVGDAAEIRRWHDGGRKNDPRDILAR